MGQENLDAAGKGNLDIFQERFFDLCGVIAETIDFRIDVFKVDRSQGILHKPGHIGTPGKAQKGRIGPDAVMISGNDYHPHGRDGRKKVVDLL